MERRTDSWVVPSEQEFYEATLDLYREYGFASREECAQNIGQLWTITIRYMDERLLERPWSQEKHHCARCGRHFQVGDWAAFSNFDCPGTPCDALTDTWLCMNAEACKLRAAVRSERT